jgi:hypothetical protein
MQLQVTKAKTKKSRKRTKRTPDGTVRSSTKLVLILLVNHRNNKTGQCNPSVQRLMDQTGYSKRTILFELQALKELGILEWQHGWGNAHAKQSNRYTVNLKEIQRRHEESAVDESAVGEDESAVGAMKVHSTTDESAARAPLTSKEPPILNIQGLNLPMPMLLDMQIGNSEAGYGAHLQNEESAPDALSYESAPNAPSSEPFAGMTESEIVRLVPHAEGMKLWRKYDSGNYKPHRAELIADVLEYQKTQEVTA